MYTYIYPLPMTIFEKVWQVSRSLSCPAGGSSPSLRLELVRKENQWWNGLIVTRCNGVPRIEESEREREGKKIRMSMRHAMTIRPAPYRSSSWRHAGMIVHVRKPSALPTTIGPPKPLTFIKQDALRRALDYNKSFVLLYYYMVWCFRLLFWCFIFLITRKSRALVTTSGNGPSKPLDVTSVSLSRRLAFVFGHNKRTVAFYQDW